MDSPPEKVRSNRTKSVNPKQLTVMVIRNVGKIRSYKISRRIIFWSAVFFIAYILGSLYIINSYIDLRFQYGKQSKELSLLGNTLEKRDKILLQTEQHVAILEDYLKSLQERAVTSKAPVEEEKPQLNNVYNATQGPVEMTEEKGKTPKSVNIEDIVIQKEDSGMSVDFKLVNTQPDGEAMEGYIHIIASDKRYDSPSEWNYPNEKLVDGLPVNFRRGQPFLIQRFKPYNRRFEPNSNLELPSLISVLVYDRAGILLLRKEFEVKNVS